MKTRTTAAPCAALPIMRRSPRGRCPFFTFAHLVFLVAIAGPAIAGEETDAPCPAMRSAHHPILDRLAAAHARDMARRCHQDHDGFSGRMAQGQSGTGLHQVAEICAESWEWQRNDSPRKLWEEMVRCWKQSPGHWSVARQEHRAIGGAMARGRNGVWYACIMAAD